jgi:outer membrane protein assembly factor BamB
MDAGKIIGGQTGFISQGFQQGTAIPKDSPQPLDSFSLSPKDQVPARQAMAKASGTAELILKEDLKPAFELKEEWAVPRRAGISPHPNVGPHGEINVSTFGDFTVVRDGSTVFETEMRDPNAKYEGYKTLSVNRPPAFSEDGMAYVPDRSGTLHAFDLNKKGKIWEFKPDRKLIDFGDTGGAIPSPILGRDDRLYMRDGSGNLYALDRKTGKEIWAMKKWALAFKEKPNSIPAPENHPPALGPDGTLYVVGKNGTIQAVDGATGKYKKDFKSFEAGESVYYSFAPVCDKEGRLYVSSRGENDPKWKISCLDGNTGGKLWDLSAGDNLASPVFGPDGTVYLGTKGGTWIRKDNPGEKQKILAIDPKTGQQKWEADIDGRIDQVEIDPEGKKLAVLHTKSNFIEAWDEVEFINNITLIDLATKAQIYNVKPGTTEKDGIHSIAFSPDGKLVAYTYPDTVKAFSINDQNLYVAKEGQKLTTADIGKASIQDTAPSGQAAGADSGVYVDEEVISIDGIKLAMKDGRLQKI